MTRLLTRVAFLGLLLAPLAVATPLQAQTPTAEGTVIKNKATATYTDANSNSYSSIADSVSVTVGFAPGVDPTSTPSVTPASPSTGNTVSVQLRNIGNGVDTASVSVTAGSGISITGYRFNGTTYGTPALVNAALAAYQIPAGGSASVDLIYDVIAGQGGQTIPLSLTMTSKRSPSTSASTTTNIVPPGTRAVAVGLDGATIPQLPSNLTTYSHTFAITNNGNASDTYSLVAALAGTPSGAVSIVTVDGAAGTTGTVTVASGATEYIAVTYSVSAAVPAGSVDKIVFTATSTGDAGISDAGDLTVTVIKAAVTMTKTAWKDDKLTLLTASSQVKPGDYIQYKIAVANDASAAPASVVQISDVLPAQVTYMSSVGDAAGWTISESGGTVTASLGGTLAPAGSRYIWIRVRVK